MNNIKLFKLFLIIGFALMLNTTKAQQTITLTPSEDAWLRICLNPSYTYITNTNYSGTLFENSGEWTISGYRLSDRAVMKFDLSAIPAGALITDAKLSLYAQNPQPEDVYRHINFTIRQNSGYKQNACYMERITQSWGETSVTWANQPATSTVNRIILPESQTENQNYTDIDVTAMVTDMVADPSNSHGFMLRLVNEEKYARMAFCSTNHSDPARWPKLEIEYEVRTNKISAGYYHSLLLKADGTLWTWGMNCLGMNGPQSVLTPIQVGTENNWKQISAGHECSAAIKNDGTLWMWGGGNEWGQLIQIGTDTDWKTVSLGNDHFLALKTDGTMWAWGSNWAGQLGDGTTNDKTSPSQVGTEENWKQISAGTFFNLALKKDGSLWAWGFNLYGQLGDETNQNRYFPIRVGTSFDWKAIYASSNFSLALKTNGTLWTWGDNSVGQLGDGTYTNRYSPAQIGTYNDWKEVSGGEYHSVALKTNGELWSWGTNLTGALGDGTNVAKNIPTQISGVSNCVQISAGKDFSLILKSDDQYCGTGANAFGELGDGTDEEKLEFNCVELPVIYETQIFCGTGHCLFLKTDGSLWSWGYNYNGQLGNGTTIDEYSPIRIGNESDWSKIASQSTSRHSLALKNDGSLWSWGWNEGGQCGDGTTVRRTSPVQIGTDYNWSKIATGATHSLAIKVDGTLWLWGDDLSGSAGDPSVYHLTPIQIGSASDWKEIAAGATFSVAIKEDGTMWHWGGNTSPGTGNGSEIPSQLGTDNDWKKVACGYHHVLAIKNNGTLWAWGQNSEGQLGDGTKISKATPVQIGTDSDWTCVSGGSLNSLAVKINGTLFTWGINTFGVLGDASITERNYPGQLLDITNCLTGSTGNVFSVILNSGDHYCGTGRNNWGQLGDGTNTNKTTFNCMSFPSCLQSEITHANESESLKLKTNDLIPKKCDKPQLLQSYPNPGKDVITLPYFVAENTIDAKIVVNSLIKGNVKEYMVTGRGMSNITIYTQDMPAGIYFYTLYINGKKADVKKMVIVK